MLSNTTPQTNDHKIVRFTNIAPFDFLPEMGAMYGGVPYFVQSGKSLLMPYPIGNHLAKHLARQIILQKAPVRDENHTDGRGGESQRSDRKLWDPAAIDSLKKEIISEVYEEERTAPKTYAEEQKERIERLNNTFPETPVVPAATTPSPESIEVPPTAPAHAPSEAPKIVEPVAYKDKAEVVAALKAKGVPFDARASKASLEKLLNN